MTNTKPIVLAAVGVGLLIWEIRSFIFIRCAFKTGKLPHRWRWRWIMAFGVGVLLVVTIPWQGYPLDGGTAAGVPFFAAWYDAEGRDFIGAITLPALLGDLVVWFLVPQLVLAYIARRNLSRD